MSDKKSKVDIKQDKVEKEALKGLKQRLKKKIVEK
jgi:hypothetical protein